MGSPASAGRSDDRARIRLALLGLLALAVLLRVFRLTGQSLWFDEGTTLQMTDSAGLLENLRRFYHLNSGGERFQPLYNLLMAKWRVTFGDGAAALRSFSALAGIGAVAFVVATARRAFGPVHALWTGALAACSSFAIFYSQEARPYAFLMLLLSAQVYCFTPILAGWAPAETSPWWRRGHVAVAAIGSFGSIFFLMFLGSLAVAHLVTVRSWREWLRWWIPAGLAALPSVAFYLGGGLAADPTKSILVTRYGFPVFESVVFVVYGVAVGLTYGPSVLELHADDRWSVVRAHAPELIALGIAGAWAVLALGRALWKGEPGSGPQRRAGVLLVVAAAIALSLGAVLAAATRVTWLPRHSFYLWVPLVLALPLLARPGARWSAVPLVLLLGMNLYSVGKYYFSYAYSKDDYRGAARYVMSTDGSLPSVLVYGWPRLLRYYGDTRTVDGTPWSPAPLDERIRELTNGAPRALAVLTHDDYWRRQLGADLPTVIGRSYAVEDVRVFQNVKVYRLALRQTARPQPVRADVPAR